jgi:hypothetical protein
MQISYAAQIIGLVYHNIIRPVNHVVSIFRSILLGFHALSRGPRLSYVPGNHLKHQTPSYISTVQRLSDFIEVALLFLRLYVYDSDFTGTNESQAFCHPPIPHTGLFASRLVLLKNQSKPLILREIFSYLLYCMWDWTYRFIISVSPGSSGRI